MTEIITVAQPPKSLVEQALEKDWDPDRLKQIIDLQVAQEKRSAEAEFNEAFNAAQAEMPKVIKDKKNLQKNTHYATLDAVVSVVTPIATKHGFASSFGEVPSTAETIISEGCRRFVLRITHRSGYFREFVGDYPLDGKGAQGKDVMNAIQGYVSTRSYAQRVITCGAWNIAPSGTDEDGNDVSDTITQSQVEVLDNLVRTMKEKGIPFDLRKFMVFLSLAETDGLSSIPVTKFNMCVTSLSGKIAKGVK
jgi:hypothetical protein